MQNLALFRTTLEFGGEYFRNGGRYSKSGKFLIYRDFSRIRRKKSGELWSTNVGVLKVESYPPKLTFSGNHISVPKKCCATKFLHALENDQVLLAHSPTGDWGFRYKFFKGGPKLA